MKLTAAKPLAVAPGVAGAWTSADNKTCLFRVWAPLHTTVKVMFPEYQTLHELQKDEHGYFHLTLDNIPAGTLYYYITGDGKSLPDPASHYQPEGVHGPSAVVDQSAFVWSDEYWKGIPFKDIVLYELHVGTFTHRERSRRSSLGCAICGMSASMLSN